MRLPVVAVVCSAVVGIALWLLTVVRLPDGESTAPGFWWLMLAAALLLGIVFGTDSAAHIALGLGVPPLVLAPWSAPRGDGDGLWVLWLPLLAVFLLVLAMVAVLGGLARHRLQRSA